MLERLAVRPHICRQIRSGPLGAWIESFLLALATNGYATSVIRRHLRAAVIFSDWLVRHRIAVADIDERVVAQFVGARARWRSPSRRNGRLSAVASGVHALAAHLWTHASASPTAPVESESELGQWLRRFDEHLEHVRGTSAGTRRIYRRYARALLTPYCGTSIVDWSALTASAVTDFVRTQTARLSPSACRAPLTATRTFLRFLITAGVLPSGVDGAVPSMRQWRQASLPPALSDKDVQRVLASVDTMSVAGARDRAVLLLLTRLGLRASDVAALTVDAIDWRNGHLRLAPGKNRRERLLPLPVDVGTALVAVLRSRPPTAPRGVLFLRARPPVRPLSAAAVTGIAQRALRRADLTVPRFGAHVFRHTVATQWVQRGVSMKTVADLLGHADLETTAIYAKLDVATLATVALPWPEVRDDR
jgi:site-specific recombinase XerD